MQPIFTISVTRWEQCFMTLTVRVQGAGRIEFRGDAFWQWDGNPVRSHGSRVCWAELLHDTLEGWHACVLHTDSEVAILPHHPDYEPVAQLIRWAETLTDREVIPLLEGRPWN